MTDVQGIISEALYQAALEGDESPKIMLSLRAVELILAAASGEASTDSDLDEMPTDAQPRVRMLIDTVMAQRGWSASRLAEALGINKSTIWRARNADYEFATSSRTLARLEALARQGETVDAPPVAALLERLKSDAVNQSELARVMRVHPSAVNKILSGIRKVKLEEAPVIAHYLDQVGA